MSNWFLVANNKRIWMITFSCPFTQNYDILVMYLQPQEDSRQRWERAYGSFIKIPRKPQACTSKAQPNLFEHLKQQQVTQNNQMLCF